MQRIDATGQERNHPLLNPKAAFMEALENECLQKALILLAENPILLEQKFDYGNILRQVLVLAKRSADEAKFCDLISAIIEKGSFQNTGNNLIGPFYEVVVSIHHNKKTPFFSTILTDMLRVDPICTHEVLSHAIHVLSQKSEHLPYLEQIVTLQPRTNLEEAILAEVPYIIKSACDEAFHLLLSRENFDINRPTSFGWTPLQIATRVESDDRIEWMLQNGAENVGCDVIKNYNAIDQMLREYRDGSNHEVQNLKNEVLTTPEYLSQPSISKITSFDSVRTFIKTGIRFNNPCLPYFFLEECEFKPAFNQDFLTELLQCASAYGGDSMENENSEADKQELINKWLTIGLKLISLGAQLEHVVFTKPELPEPFLDGVPVKVRESVESCKTYINHITPFRAKSAASQ